MIACLESPSLANISIIRRSVASVMLEVSESDKDEGFSVKMQFLHLLLSYVMEVAHWTYVFAVIDSPCAQLARPRTASSAVSLPGSLRFTN